MRTSLVDLKVPASETCAVAGPLIPPGDEVGVEVEVDDKQGWMCMHEAARAPCTRLTCSDRVARGEEEKKKGVGVAERFLAEMSIFTHLAQAHL